MTVSNLATVAVCDLDLAGGSSFTFDQITDSNFDPRLTEVVESAAGYEANHVSSSGGKPTLSITTKKVGIALAALTCVGKGLDGAGIRAYFQKYLAGGGRDTTGHPRVALATGIVLPRTLQCTYQQDATLSLDAFATSVDGDTSPYTWDTAALPTAGTDEHFTLATAVLGAASMGQITDLNIDFGLTERIEGAADDLWPSFACVEAVRPKITMKCNAPANFALYAPVGTAIVNTSPVIIYLRKRVKGGGLLEIGTANHISLTVYEGMIIARQTQASVGNPASIDVEVIQIGRAHV
jgi:hypothetical protein